MKLPLALLTDVRIDDLASSIKQFGRLALKTATLSGPFGTVKNPSPEDIVKQVQQKIESEAREKVQSVMGHAGYETFD